AFQAVPRQGRLRPFLSGAIIVGAGAGATAWLLLKVTPALSLGWPGVAAQILLLKCSFSLRGLFTAARAVQRALATGGLDRAPGAPDRASGPRADGQPQRRVDDRRDGRRPRRRPREAGRLPARRGAATDRRRHRREPSGRRRRGRARRHRGGRGRGLLAVNI